MRTTAPLFRRMISDASGRVHQPYRLRVGCGLLVHRLVELCQRSVELIEHMQQLLSLPAGPLIQLESFQFASPFPGEQLLLAAQPLSHGQGMQLIANRIAHPHQLLSMP